MLYISPFVAFLLTVLVVAAIGALVGFLVSRVWPIAGRFLSVVAGLLVALILGLLVWLIVISTVTFSPRAVAPPVVVSNPALGAPYVAQPVPAQSQPLPAACSRRLMTTSELTNLVDSVSSDEFADTLTVLIGKQVDTQCLKDFTSPVGSWPVTGPAVILTDPGHQPFTGGARVVKTWHFQTDWIFGVYFCPSGSVCTVPTPGRAIFLDGNLPDGYLH